MVHIADRIKQLNIFLTEKIRVLDMENLVKIREYILRPNGDRGLCVSLPEDFFRDRGYAVGDTVAFLAAPDSDDLILRPVKIRKPSASKVK